MSNRLLLGLWRAMIPVPQKVWQGRVSKAAQATVAGLGFMSEEHRRVSNFVVREIPRFARPLPPAYIAEELELSLGRVRTILEELERAMTFLYRGDGEAVTWAYPVTVDVTPHHVTFSTGEESYAA